MNNGKRFWNPYRTDRRMCVRCQYVDYVTRTWHIILQHKSYRTCTHHPVRRGQHAYTYYNCNTSIYLLLVYTSKYGIYGRLCAPYVCIMYYDLRREIDECSCLDDSTFLDARHCYYNVYRVDINARITSREIKRNRVKYYLTLATIIMLQTWRVHIREGRAPNTRGIIIIIIIIRDYRRPPSRVHPPRTLLYTRYMCYIFI